MSNLRLLWKTVCPEFTAVNIYFLPFRILNNLCLPWKTDFALKFFPVLKYFLSCRIFEQVVLARKTEFALHFQAGGGLLPPRPPPRTPLSVKWVIYNQVRITLARPIFWPFATLVCVATHALETNELSRLWTRLSWSTVELKPNNALKQRTYLEWHRECYLSTFCTFNSRSPIFSWRCCSVNYIPCEFVGVCGHTMPQITKLLDVLRAS